MCFSMCAQAAYAAIMFVCLCLTIASLCTPGWRKFTEEAQQSVQNLHMPEAQGILPFACSFPGDGQSSTGTTSNPSDYCEKWWKNLADWERAVIICMCLAIVAEVAALLWNCFTWCACCCKKYLIHPLSPLSFLVVLFLAIAVIVYGVNNETAFEGVTDFQDVQDKMKSEVGYSFWLAIGALVLAVINTVVAAVAVFCGERCC